MVRGSKVTFRGVTALAHSDATAPPQSNRRFTRLTNSFSKKLQYHRAALALTFFYYNFCRKHSSLKGKTPAMAAGIASTVWTVRDMLFAADQMVKAA